jgi:hypothetical protein
MDLLVFLYCYTHFWQLIIIDCLQLIPFLDEPWSSSLLLWWTKNSCWHVELPGTVFLSQKHTNSLLTSDLLLSVFGLSLCIAVCVYLGLFWPPLIPSGEPNRDHCLQRFQCCQKLLPWICLCYNMIIETSNTKKPQYCCWLCYLGNVFTEPLPSYTHYNTLHGLSCKYFIQSASKQVKISK